MPTVPSGKSHTWGAESLKLAGRHIIRQMAFLFQAGKQIALRLREPEKVTIRKQ
jgi:hypothetical protein